MDKLSKLLIDLIYSGISVSSRGIEDMPTGAANFAKTLDLPGHGHRFIVLEGFFKSTFLYLYQVNEHTIGAFDRYGKCSLINLTVDRSNDPIEELARINLSWYLRAKEDNGGNPMPSEWSEILTMYGLI